MAGLNLNINGDARRARAALDDVANGSLRAARVADQLSRSYDHLEREASQAQRRIDELNDEISNSGPTAELTAEITELQHRLSNIGDERFGLQRLQAQFRRSTSAAQQLDHQLAETRRELDRLNDEYSRGGDPAVLRRIQDQQREMERLAGIRRRIAAEDEENQHRLGRLAAEAHRAQMLRDLQARRQAEEDERNRRGFLGNAARSGARIAQRGVQRVTGSALDYADANQGSLYGKAALLGAAVPVGVTALAAVGGAVIGAGAIAAVGIGIKGAVDGPGGQIIKDEFGDLIEGLQSRLTSSTADWSKPLVEAAHTFGDALDAIPMEQIFTDAKGFIGPLAEGFAGLAEGAGKGFGALVREGQPVVERLGKEFKDLGGDIEVAFEAISQGAEGGADALGDLIDLLGSAVRATGMVVLGAEHIYEEFKKIPVLGAAYEKLLDFWTPDDPEAIPAFAADIDGVAQSIDGAASSADHFAGVQDLLTEASKRATEAIATELGELLGLDEATDAAVRAYQELLESLKATGYQLEGNGKKALDNRDALRETVDAWMDERDAAVAAGDGSAAAMDSANAALLKHLEQLRSVLTAHHADTTAVDQYIAAVKAASGLVLLTIHRNVYENIGTPFERQKTGQSRGSGYASGGTVAETGWAMVGEQGPEMRFLNKGDYILDAQKTARALTSSYTGGSGGGASGGPARLVVSGGGEFGSFIQKLVDAGQIQLYAPNGGGLVTAR